MRASHSQFRHSATVAMPAGVVAIALCLIGASCGDAAELAVECPVGMPRSILQRVLPGSELEALPTTDESAIVLRIDAVYPHGSDFRYDFTYYGVEPGEYDLRQCLRRKDGSSLEGLPAVPLRITGVLPPGQIEPGELKSGVLPRMGGYRWLFLAAVLTWLVAGYWVLFPRRRASAIRATTIEPPQTLADRLRPLVQDAIAGRLPAKQLAELERLLVEYWRRRLHLEETAPAQARAQLRTHPEAGPLVSQLEVWLHHPPGRQAVDVETLLKPYRQVGPEALSIYAPAVREATS